MDTSEAEDLLRKELKELGYDFKESDDEYFRSILQTAGGLPLALKWAAQITHEKRSLYQASRVLAGAGHGKRELLDFCFASMFEALSDTGRQTAALIPILDAEWKPMTLSIALDLPVDKVKMAIEEIADNGIIFTTDENKADDGYALLPLTKEFLLRRWEEAKELQTEVKERIAEMFSSGQGNLLDLPIDQRIPLIKEVAREKAERGEQDKALKLVQLALDWKQRDPSLRFMQGQLVYESQSRDAGIAHMEQAIKLDEEGHILTSQDVYYYAKALFARGPMAEREAFDFVGSIIRRESTEGSNGRIGIPLDILTSFIECGLQRREFKQVIDGVVRLDMDEQARLLFGFRQLKPILETPAIIHEQGEKLLDPLDRLSRSTVAEEEEREWFSAKAKEIRRKLNL
jgi:tetratricopeptide (TPR) repeat protein